MSDKLAKTDGFGVRRTSEVNHAVSSIELIGRLSRTAAPETVEFEIGRLQHALNEMRAKVLPEVSYIAPVADEAMSEVWGIAAVQTEVA